MERITLFADVILPLSVPKLYTYRIPASLMNFIKPGHRVIVQFGKSRKYTAIVNNIHTIAPSAYSAKYIDCIVDEHPLLNELQLQFWNWISSYYLCHPGEVLNAALPSGLKLSSETKVILSGMEPGDEIELDPFENEIYEMILARKEIKLTEILSQGDTRKYHQAIKKLLKMGLIVLEEEVSEKYKIKKEQFIHLNPEWSDEEKLNDLLNGLEKKAFKQLEVLLKYLHLSGKYSGHDKEVKKAELLNGIKSKGAFQILVDKGVLEVSEKRMDRIRTGGVVVPFKALLDGQVKALDEIKSHFDNNKTVLLHGVTSSGKTELYIQLIRQALERKGQVLYLLPEIALTSQIINRLRAVFGSRVGVYHSRFNDQERVEIWEKTNMDFNQSNMESLEKFDIILGARSSVFLPFKKLELIIIDEEHDPSYKQQEPAPRYHARDAALMLGKLQNSKVILGSATPSVESYHNATIGKYGLVKLTNRFGGMEMPEIIISDLKTSHQKREMHSNFTPLLKDSISQALAAKEQIILFRNRRGFAPALECRVCSNSVVCKNCDITLSYHKHNDSLKCHYCGFTLPVQKKCRACGSDELILKGYGTERIEDDLSILFPDARVARLDLDTTRTKSGYQKILNEFEDQKIQILVGTQMVTKGLDFDHVSLVGILSADGMLSFPDFRAHERAYQLMAQVSGRAGRKNKRGKVIIQAFNTTHQIVDQVIRNDYESMFKNSIEDRRKFNYPPFCRLIQITLKHREKERLDAGAWAVFKLLKRKLGTKVLGPEYPSITRIRNLFQKQILIKLDRNDPFEIIKIFILNSISEVKEVNEFKSLIVQPDVDPA